MEGVEWPCLEFSMPNLLLGDPSPKLCEVDESYPLITIVDDMYI